MKKDPQQGKKRKKEDGGLPTVPDGHPCLPCPVSDAAYVYSAPQQGRFGAGECQESGGTRPRHQLRITKTNETSEWGSLLR